MTVFRGYQWPDSLPGRWRSPESALAASGFVALLKRQRREPSIRARTRRLSVRKTAGSITTTGRCLVILVLPNARGRAEPAVRRVERNFVHLFGHAHHGSDGGVARLWARARFWAKVSFLAAGLFQSEGVPGCCSKRRIHLGGKAEASSLLKLIAAWERNRLRRTAYRRRKSVPGSFPQPARALRHLFKRGLLLTFAKLANEAGSQKRGR
jgi:hypothetical protein